MPIKSKKRLLDVIHVLRKETKHIMWNHTEPIHIPTDIYIYAYTCVFIVIQLSGQVNWTFMSCPFNHHG